MVVPISTTYVFTAARPRVLFWDLYVKGQGWADYDVSPDGERFVMVNSGEEERAPTEIKRSLQLVRRARTPRADTVNTA